MATSNQQKAPVKGATSEHQKEGRGVLANELATVSTCRVALDSEDVEGSRVLAWLEPDEANQAFVSWRHASGAVPTQVAIELAGTPSELIAWIVPFDEDDEELDAETEAVITALRADLPVEGHAEHSDKSDEAPPAGAEPAPGFEGNEPEEQLKRFFDALGIEAHCTFVLSACYESQDPKNPDKWYERWTHRKAVRMGTSGDAELFNTLRYGKSEPTDEAKGRLSSWRMRKASIGTRNWQYFLRTAVFKLDEEKQLRSFEQTNVERRREYFVEADGIPLDEQRRRVEQLEAEGLRFNAVVFSGRKSLQLSLKRPQSWHSTPEQDRWIDKALCVLFDGDTMAQLRNQAHRLPGFKRAGKHDQQLLWARKETYDSYGELRAVLERLLSQSGVEDLDGAYSMLVASQGKTAQQRQIEARNGGDIADGWDAWDGGGGWSKSERRVAAMWGGLKFSTAQLIALMPKRTAELVKEGSASGCRNEDGLRLTLELRGIVDLLTNLGVSGLEEQAQGVLERFIEASGGDVDENRLFAQYGGAEGAKPGKSVEAFMHSLSYETGGMLGERKAAAQSGEVEGQVAPALMEQPFEVLGWADGDREGIYYRAKATGQIAQTKCRTRAEILRLAPLEHWIEVFGRRPEEQGRPRQAPPDWDAAMSAVIAEADRTGVFDLRSLRGHGVWLDGGRVVWHLGDRIEVDGVLCSLEAADGKFHYARLHALKVDPAVVPIQNAEGEAVLGVIRQMGWASPVDPLHLAGWIVLANVGGALLQRPGLQLTSSSGSGKSDCVSRVIEPLLAGLAVYSSTSSEAGVRQTLKSSSLPAVIDESEQENAKKREAQLRLVRLSYDGVPQLMGTPSGEARSYTMRSSICLVGINASIPNVADRNRIVVISRQQIPDDAWAEASRLRDELITCEVGERLLRRTVSNLKTLLANVESFGRVVAKRYGGRPGDTYGALLAGAHHLTSLEMLDEAQACQWIDAQGWKLSDEELAGSAAKDEAEQCLEHLLKHEVPFANGYAEDWGNISDASGKTSIREVIQYICLENGTIACGRAEDFHKEGQKTLGRYGLKLDQERGLIVHTGGKGKLPDVYAGTRWANGAYKDRLLDLPGVERVPSTVRMHPLPPVKACIALPLSLVLG